MVTAYDSESGRPGSKPEWGLIYYEASITAQGLPEPSSLRGSTLGTRAAEHKGCNWGMQVDWWLQPCAVFNHSFNQLAYATEMKSIQLHDSIVRLSQKIVSFTLHYITLHKPCFHELIKEWWNTLLQRVIHVLRDLRPLLFVFLTLELVSRSCSHPLSPFSPSLFLLTLPVGRLRSPLVQPLNIEST